MSYLNERRPEPTASHPGESHNPQPGLSASEPAPTPFSPPSVVWGLDNLTAAVGTSAPHLWQGYLIPGAVTLLTSLWKSGKTTLASVLLARMKSGGQLAGLSVAPGKAVVVSEESPDHWARRAGKLDFGDHIGWFCRPFQGRPAPGQWRDFVDHVAALHDRRNLSLVLIDPLAAFMPGNENNAAGMLEVLTPLQRLNARNLAVWIMHHPSKGDPPIGQMARGSGALAGYVDILIEMRSCPGAAADDRRRRLYAYSRYDETPRQRVIEWTADGLDYISHGTFREQEHAVQWQTIHAILARAAAKLTRSEIRRQWPHSQIPDKTTLYRWLERAVDRGLVSKDGTGFRNRPFQYWLPKMAP
jgi:hypothetical protein